jgi:hypothetical protein
MRAGRALKNSQLTGGETYTYFGDRTLAWIADRAYGGRPGETLYG